MNRCATQGPCPSITRMPMKQRGCSNSKHCAGLRRPLVSLTTSQLHRGRDLGFGSGSNIPLVALGGGVEGGSGQRRDGLLVRRRPRDGLKRRELVPEGRNLLLSLLDLRSRDLGVVLRLVKLGVGVGQPSPHLGQRLRSSAFLVRHAVLALEAELLDRRRSHDLIQYVVHLLEPVDRAEVDLDLGHHLIAARVKTNVDEHVGWLLRLGAKVVLQPAARARIAVEVRALFDLELPLHLLPRLKHRVVRVTLDGAA
mmetsp:Transcript_26513/g.62188  ORF Transcript_26513/g.62188 Transcript_26513/m.62188 type:complete len:254 (-) Transcript_26513:1019-1780(-)